jgi:hypothetical protein
MTDIPDSLGPEDAEELSRDEGMASQDNKGGQEVTGTTQSASDCPPDAQTLTDAELRALCPRTYKPNENQLRLVRAYVSADAAATFPQIVDSLGLKRKTVRQWFHRHAEMHIWLREALMHSMDVSAVWRALKARALAKAAGNNRAAHMVLLRFDPDYAAAVGKGLPTLKGDTGPSRADVKAAEAVLKAQETPGGEGKGGGGISNMSPKEVDPQKPIPEEDDSESKGV